MRKTYIKSKEGAKDKVNLTNIDKLNMLIEQGMFEPVELDEKNIIDENGRGDFRIIYLMNDTVESFLVFKNAKYTGEYNDKFDGLRILNLKREKRVMYL